MATNFQNMPRDIPETAERRKKARIVRAFPVQVSGVDADGRDFRIHTVVDNLSAGGLYMQLARRVEAGSRVEVVIRYSNEEPSACIVAGGIIRRVEECPHGLCGVGVEFIRYQFMESPHSEGDTRANA